MAFVANQTDITVDYYFSMFLIYLIVFFVYYLVLKVIYYKKIKWKDFFFRQ